MTTAAIATLPALGTLMDRVLFKRLQADIDRESYMSVGSLWARVRSHSGNGKSTHSIIIRYRSDIHERDRFVYRGRNLDVVSAGDLNGRRAYLYIEANEVQPWPL